MLKLEIQAFFYYLYEAATAELFLMKLRLFFATTFIRVLTGIDNYLYAYGVAKLPVSTSFLLVVMELAFTAVFSFVIVKQKFTAYSVNAVVLQMVVLGLYTSGDRLEGEPDKQYRLGFFMSLSAAATMLYGLIMSLVELTYKRAKMLELEWKTIRWARPPRNFSLVSDKLNYEIRASKCGGKNLSKMKKTN